MQVQVDLPDRPATVNDIKLSGPGINPKYIRDNTPITFKVDASKSAKGKVFVSMENDKGKKTWIVLFF